MSHPMAKGLKRCPSCKSSAIYKRTRAVCTIRDTRKRNGNKIERYVKMYICQKCKYEFDKPIII